MVDQAIWVGMIFLLGVSLGYTICCVHHLMDMHKRRREFVRRKYSARAFQQQIWEGILKSRKQDTC